MAGGIFIAIFKKEEVESMKFTEALMEMKEGALMKLPTWGGIGIGILKKKQL